MNTGSIIFAIVFWLFSGIFLFIASKIRKMEKPVHFYTFKDPPKPEELTSVADYNRANATMWHWYSWLFGVGSLVAARSVTAGGVLMGLLSTVGVVILIIAYNRIYRKYKVSKE